MDRDVPALVRGMVASLAMAYPEFGGRVLSAITAGTGQPDVMELAGLFDADAKPESTEGGRRVSVLKRQEGAPVDLG